VVVGFAVAGGQSRRMGRDKALLAWGESTLLDHTISRLDQACDAVRLLTGPEARYGDRGLPADVDAVPGTGPLGALYTGLLGLRGEALGLFLAVDLPWVPVSLLRALPGLAEGFDAVAPVSARGPEPLCAVYRRSCLEPVLRHLQAGELRMTSFWPQVRVRRVGEAELRPYGDPTVFLRNLNTPEEYEQSTPCNGP
jgi:molybdopterin-guanine dinucleotide biosynthesis protein A